MEQLLFYYLLILIVLVIVETLCVIYLMKKYFQKHEELFNYKNILNSYDEEDKEILKFRNNEDFTFPYEIIKKKDNSNFKR